MKKHLRLIALVIVTLMMAAILAACGGGDAATPTPGAATPAPTPRPPAPTADPNTGVVPTLPPPPRADLIFYSWGDPPSGMDEVLAEFEKRTADTLNMSIEWIWRPQADYANNLDLMLSARQTLDVVFDATWMRLNNYAAQGVYNILNEYFDDAEHFPGLQNFHPLIIENNQQMNPVIGRQLFAVPLMQTFGQIQGYAIRKDLRVKHGVPEIKSWDDLYKFWDVIAANEPGISPVSGNGFFNQTDMAGQFPNMEANRMFQIPIGGGAFAVVQLSPDRRTAIDLFVGSDPRIVDGNWFNQAQAAAFSEWHERGWLPADYATQANPARNGALVAGTVASGRETTAVFGQRVADLARNVPSGELEFFVSNEKARNFEPQALQSGFGADNFVAVPVTSRHLDRAMMFMSWLFENEDNNNLFTLGVEGLHWNKVGDDRFEIPAGAPVYNFQPFKLSWNTNYVRQNIAVPDMVFDYFMYTTNPDNFFPNYMAGFQPNTVPYANSLPMMNVATQVDALQIVQNPTIPLAQKRTMLDNVYNSQVVPAGVDAIKTELLKQVTDWIAANR